MASPLSFISPGADEPTHPLTVSVVEEWEKRPEVVEVRTTIRLPGREYTTLEFQDSALPISLSEQALPFDEPFAADIEFVAGQDLRPGREGGIVLGQDVVLNFGESPEAFVGQAVSIPRHLVSANVSPRVALEHPAIAEYSGSTLRICLGLYRQFAM